MKIFLILDTWYSKNFPNRLNRPLRKAEQYNNVYTSSSKRSTWLNIMYRIKYKWQNVLLKHTSKIERKWVNYLLIQEAIASFHYLIPIKFTIGVNNKQRLMKYKRDSLQQYRIYVRTYDRSSLWKHCWLLTVRLIFQLKTVKNFSICDSDNSY